MADAERLRRALAAIDAANAGDPQRIEVRGQLRPKELAHAELVSEWIERLCPDASEALRLAARAHHVRRWEIPRERHPEGRSGYLRWRKALSEHHAKVAGEILASEGYAEPTIARVQEIVRKKNLGRDAEVQALEDALCLVFLETQFHDVAARLEPEKLLEVTRKTLGKMSPRALDLAAQLPLDPRDRAWIERARG
ncbi:MAG TPA: DUF4202 domain-containing protein [Myxococcota bacterium]